MNIKDFFRTYVEMNFEELEVGDTFIYHNHLHRKMDKFTELIKKRKFMKNAIDLHTGLTTTMLDFEEVKLTNDPFSLIERII